MKVLAGGPRDYDERKQSPGSSACPAGSKATNSPKLQMPARDSGPKGGDLIAKQDSGRATISEIAREAGVFVPTVSKVLNEQGRVSETTRAKVEAIIAKHDYARQPSKQRKNAGLIDLVFPGMGSEWAREIVEGVERVAQEAGYGTVVSSLSPDGSTMDPWLANLAERKSDGMLLAVFDLDSARIQRIKSLDIPMILINPVGQPDPDLTTVSAANLDGAFSATRHLLGLGHTRIGMIGGREGLPSSSARQRGFMAALRHARVAIEPSLIVPGDFSMESGASATEELLALPERPTAIFAGNDAQALGAYQTALGAGVRIPDDLSIIGFDDIPAAEWIGLGLTTVRQPVIQIAATAMRTLLRHLEGIEELPQRIELRTELVVRGSTAAPST